MQNEAVSLVAMRSKELWLVQKIMPLLNLTQMASRGTKTYSESRIEPESLQILKKIKSVVIRAAWWPEKLGYVALNIEGVERICSENLQLWSTPFDLSFEWKECENLDGGNLHLPWLVILESVWYSVCYTLWLSPELSWADVHWQTGIFVLVSKIMCLF